MRTQGMVCRIVFRSLRDLVNHIIDRGESYMGDRLTDRQLRSRGRRKKIQPESCSRFFGDPDKAVSRFLRDPYKAVTRFLRDPHKAVTRFLLIELYLAGSGKLWIIIRTCQIHLPPIMRCWKSPPLPLKQAIFVSFEWRRCSYCSIDCILLPCVDLHSM
jgi:hypothetical protein